MIRMPSSGPRMRFTASATNLIESMSSPESVSSRIAISGFSIAIFRIWRPSTLARRSLISKSANLLFLLLHHVSAVIVRFSHPGRSSHVGSEKPLIHLLLVDARQPGAGGDVLDGAVAVADRQPAVPKLDHLGHVPVLGGEPGELANSRCKV